jgi:hypothetical protein
MPEPKNKLLDAVTRMIELTQQNRMKWQLRSDIPNHRIVNPLSPVFYSFPDGKRLRLYQTAVGYSGRDILNAEIPDSDKRIVLEFIDPEGEILWAFPDVAPLFDLFSAVQYQVAGVSSFMDSILGDAG